MSNNENNIPQREAYERTEKLKLSQTIDYTFFPRADFEMDFWNLSPEITFDLFDIYDPQDLRLAGDRLEWIEKPAFLSLEDRVKDVVPTETRSKKYRIAVDCRGINSKSIKCMVTEDKKKLIVSAREGEIKSRDSDNYTLREFKRTYRLPAHAETEKLASYRAPNGKLIIEIPIGTVQHENKSPAIQHDTRLAASTLDDVDRRIIEDILPRVSDDGKQILMSFQLPTGGDKVIDASNIKVTLKDRDVIVVIEDDSTNTDDLSQFFFYKRITMPDNADLATLKCTLENNRLVIKAPVIERIGTDTKGSVKLGPRIKEDSKSLT